MDDASPALLTSDEQFYADLLDPEDRAAFDQASNGPDLGADIRLLRALIGRLAADGGLTRKEAAIRQAIGILYRLIQVQRRTVGDEDDFEREVRAAADSFLAAQRGDAPREDGEDEL
jgi:hypothetical protein